MCFKSRRSYNNNKKCIILFFFLLESRQNSLCLRSVEVFGIVSQCVRSIASELVCRRRGYQQQQQMRSHFHCLVVFSRFCLHFEPYRFYFSLCHSIRRHFYLLLKVKNSIHFVVHCIIWLNRENRLCCVLEKWFFLDL